jgi:hypothetical protein
MMLRRTGSARAIKAESNAMLSESMGGLFLVNYRVYQPLGCLRILLHCSVLQDLRALVSELAIPPVTWLMLSEIFR